MLPFLVETNQHLGLGTVTLSMQEAVAVHFFDVVKEL